MAEGRILRKCQVCNNPVREGEIFCYLHKDSVPHAGNPLKATDISESIAIRENYNALRELTLVANRKAPGSLTLNEVSAEFLAEVSRLDKKTALKVADAAEIINARRPQLNVPTYVAQNFGGLLNEFQTDLIESGIDPKRISRLQMSDATRQIGNGRLEHSAEVHHTVLVIDRGQPTESTVDIGISLFAPVPNPNLDVADQYDTKFSPFGYAPFVSTVDTYKNEQYIWFKNFRYLD